MWESPNYSLQAIYLHIPFCLQKCAYCDFYSTTQFSAELMERYVFVMRQLLREKADYFRDSQIRSVFFGGGTPSLLSERQVASVLATIRSEYSLSEDAEISLEVNPATLTPNKVLGYQMSGVNRISLGAQSFQAEELKTLGRVHTVKQIEETVNMVRRAGITNLNLDLIYGIPGQSIRSWRQNLAQAVACEVDHLSLYLLQLEAEVPLARCLAQGELLAMDEESEVLLYETALDDLSSQGYTQYEISNFARDGKECRHNLTYWQADPYLGIGAGAVSFIDNTRVMMHSSLEQFLTQEAQNEILEEMNSNDLMLDALILGLRLNRGVNIIELAGRFSCKEIENFRSKFTLLAEQGLVEVNWPQVVLSRKGLFLSNMVFRHLL